MDGPDAGMTATSRRGGPSDRILVDLDWRSVATAMVALVGLFAVTGLVRSIPRTLTWCVIGGLMALALNPVIDGAERRLDVRRGFAVATVLSGFLLAVVLLVLLLGPATARQVRDLQEDIPEVVAQLDDLPVIGDDLAEADVPEKVEEFLQDLPSRLAGDTAPIEGAARSLISGAIAGSATILVTVALLLDGQRVIRGARRIVPRRHRDRIDRVGRLFYDVVGRYFAGSLLVASVAGLSVLIVGLILGVPLSPLLAVWVAVFDLVPQIGGAMGGVPFVLLAFTQGPGTGVIAAVFFVLYLQFENNVLSPLVVGEAVNLSPPATMVAALVGVSSAGVPGALVAVPLLGVTKAVYQEFRPGTSSDQRRRETENLVEKAARRAKALARVGRSRPKPSAAKRQATKPKSTTRRPKTKARHPKAKTSYRRRQKRK